MATDSSSSKTGPSRPARSSTSNWVLKERTKAGRIAASSSALDTVTAAAESKRAEGLATSTAAAVRTGRHHCENVAFIYHPTSPDANTRCAPCPPVQDAHKNPRSEEHTSELQSLMRISYAIF